MGINMLIVKAKNMPHPLGRLFLEYPQQYLNVIGNHKEPRALSPLLFQSKVGKK